MNSIPVVDLFAGCGGLGEGFAALNTHDAPFDVVLSVEKEPAACRSLEIRALFHAFRGAVPESYYDFMRGELEFEDLRTRHPDEAAIAAQRVLQFAFGQEMSDNLSVDQQIRGAVGSSKNWVLVGGPPCQAFSTVGRSRLKHHATLDLRHYLYREYLRILAEHRPPVFVMENVKGLLSSRVDGQSMFGRMLDDLECAGADVPELRKHRHISTGYSIYSFVQTPSGQADIFGRPDLKGEDFVIQCEKYGVPQKRHRVILLGVRQDIDIQPDVLKEHHSRVTVADAIGDLPRLRSGLTTAEDDGPTWLEILRTFVTGENAEEIAVFEPTLDDVGRGRGGKILEPLLKEIGKLKAPRCGRGKDFLRYPKNQKKRCRVEGILDERLGGVCDHVTRGHLAEDIHRYMYAAAYARVNGESPLLGEFPEFLRPKHKNINTALKYDNFPDRFRVQLSDRPSRTIMSHIAKDGHYYIHYDPTQARTLTVREAARIQTFPDNFYFAGNRTEQYTQIGNAVPPLLAHRLAGIIADTLERAQSGNRGRFAAA